MSSLQGLRNRYAGWRRTPEIASFWRWFLSNEQNYRDFEQDQEAKFEALDGAAKVDSYLTFEFGPKVENGSRDFVISADGNKEAFAAVVELVSGAPHLERWNLIAFRPRRTLVMDIVIDGQTIEADSVRYLIFKDNEPAKIGLMLFMQGYMGEAHSLYRQAGFLMLDQAIGECDIETHVGAIVFQKCDSEYFARSRSLSELASHFDELIFPKRQKIGSWPTH